MKISFWFPSPAGGEGLGVRGTALAVALLLLSTCSPTLFAQQPTRPPALPPNDQQTQLFRGLLHFHQIKPEAIENIRGGYDYSKLIVVVYGDPRSQPVVNLCRNTLANGGAVLIAADNTMELSSFFPQGGDVRISGGKVSHTDPEAADGGIASRPLVQPRANAGPSPFTGLGRIATDRPSYLVLNDTPRGVPLNWVAEFGGGVTIESNGKAVKYSDFLQFKFALATTDTRAAVRCMVVADQDVFSNRLIYTSGREANPTDNLKLANNTVQWLKGSGRTKCLFVENGTPATKFDEFEFSSIPVGPPMPPMPNIPLPNPFDHDFQRKLADTANKELDKAERNDVMDRGILAAFHGNKGILIAVLAGVLLGVTYLLFRWRTMTGWYRKVFRPIPKDPAMLGPDVPVGSIEHRRLELLRSADYGPVLRPVVLQLFQDRGLAGEYTSDKLPPLDIAVARPQFLRDAIHSLWAVVRTTAPVGYGRWKQLEPLLAAVRAAAADDRWRFAAPSPRDAAS